MTPPVVPASVVIHVNGVSPQPGAGVEVSPPANGSGPIAAQKPVAPVDPYAMHKAFPQMWSTFIREHYGSVLNVQNQFSVSERTARKWWKAEGGCNGVHVAVAFHHHPEQVNAMLIAAE